MSITTSRVIGSARARTQSRNSTTRPIGTKCGLSSTRFKITYIYVGPTERRDFTPEGIAKFQTLKWVCAEGDAAVYPVEAIPAQAPVVAGNSAGMVA